MCHNIIPTKVNQRHWQVIDEASCEACNLAEESSGHVFWECGKAQEVWSLTGIVFETQGIRYQEFVDMVWYFFFQHARDDTLEMIFMVAWCMWYNRNTVRHVTCEYSSIGNNGGAESSSHACWISGSKPCYCFTKDGNDWFLDIANGPKLQDECGWSILMHKFESKLIVRTHSVKKLEKQNTFKVHYCGVN